LPAITITLSAVRIAATIANARNTRNQILVNGNPTIAAIDPMPTMIVVPTR
jgi:hypothetical protein